MEEKIKEGENPEHKKLPQSYGIAQLKMMQYDVFKLTGKWKTLFGRPEKGVTWFIWGNSGNGKSSACAMLAYLLAGFAKVLYLSLEEKRGKSIRTKLIEAGFNASSKNFQLLDKSSYAELVRRLHRRGSEDVVFVDSLQYWGISTKQYQTLIERFPSKTFVFVSHASGGNPKGSVGEAIHYDAGVKIWVEGGRMSVKHRFEGGGGQLVVIPQLAKIYWNE